MTNTNKNTALEDLQEQALRLDIDIKDKNGQDLNASQLTAAIEAKEADENDELTPEEREHAKAQANSRAAERQAREEVGAGMRAVPDQIAPPSLSSNAPGRPKRMRPISLEPRLIANPDHLKGLPDVTDEDKELAKHYDYPVVIPGAKAYKTDVSFRCAYSGSERPAGSIVLLTDAHARNKLDYLTPVDELPVREPARQQPQQAARSGGKKHSGGKSGGK